MPNDPVLSRRAMFALAVTPACRASMRASGDEYLLALCSEFDATVLALGREGDHDVAVQLLNRLERITTEMIRTPANSIDGLRAKARATAWALEHELGMLDPVKESTTNNRLAASIVRDLLCA